MLIRLDIIVCTYDREDLLQECIEALLDQSYDPSMMSYNITIVNNAPSSLSPSIHKALSSYDLVTVIHEKKAGLSIARNAGITFVNGDWLAFVDDDALVPKDYVQRIGEIIKEESWDCFGGHINSWWKYERPGWLHEEYGSKPKLSRHRMVLTDKYNWGSNIILKKESLNAVGNFPIKIGMKGKQLGYAAENIVQDKLREQGYAVGYDPHLYVDHLVLPQKLRLGWHIKSTYATGRDGRKVFPDQYNWKGMLISVKNCISRPLRAISFWLTHPTTHPKSVLLEFAKPYALLLGKIMSYAR